MRCLTLATVAAVAATGTALAGLAACSHPVARPAASASSPAVRQIATGAGSPTVAPVNCRRQYDTWRQGRGNGLVAALTAVGSASTAGDTRVLTAALKKAEPTIAAAARYPVPACADPKGYWEVLLMHVNAAAASTGSASGLRAAMKGVPAITRGLLAELKRVDG